MLVCSFGQGNSNKLALRADDLAKGLYWCHLAELPANDDSQAVVGGFNQLFGLFEIGSADVISVD